jgi:nickel-dependent lactate racemase
MSEEAIDHLVGATAAERAERYPNVAVFNHRWDLPEALVKVGSILRTEAARLSDGLLTGEVPVVLNRMILDYDQLVICGPVFPHEVVGFSGGAHRGRAPPKSPGPRGRRRSSSGGSATTPPPST